MLSYANTVIIGAGQSGLAISAELVRKNVDHVVLERGQVANSWKTERWDSLEMLTPNWMNGAPDHAYDGADKDGYMRVSELVARLEHCAQTNAAPMHTETTVLSVDIDDQGYHVQTDRGAIMCRNVVMANGACAISKIPNFADHLPDHIMQTTPTRYKRPSDVPSGKVIVVGASASGLQLARELQTSGREVILAVGNHLRLPRSYRGTDICAWMDLIGATSIPYTDVDDIRRVRRTPSLPLVANNTLDLNSLQDLGVEVTGRMVGVAGSHAHFSGSLANLCVAADLKMNRLLASIEEWIASTCLNCLLPDAEEIAPTRTPASPRLDIDLERDDIRTVIWATGYRPDFSWLNMPVFDPKGQLVHDGGFVRDGLYAMGLPYMRQRKSTFLQGAPEDAAAVVDHMERAGRLGQNARSAIRAA